MENTMDYWGKKLGTCTERCDLKGLQKPRVNANTNQLIGEEYRQTELNISESLHASLTELCAKYSVGLPTVLEYVWHKVLSVYGHGDQTVVLNASSADLLPVVIDHQKPMSIIEFVRKMEKQIKKERTLTADQAKNNLFDSLFIFGDSILENHAVPIYLRVLDETFIISYAVHQFLPSIVQGFLEVITTILEQIVQNEMQQMASTLTFVPIKQLNQMAAWNNTDGDFPSTKRLHHLFEQVADVTPDKIAVITKDAQLSYKELNQRSNQLGHYFHDTIGLKPEQFIAIFLDKTEILLITVFGIWKSGAAYVPIDPTFPDERIQYIFQDTKAQFVITNEHYASRLQKIFKSQSNGPQIIQIEPLLQQFQREMTPVTNLELELTSSQLAYVTYTSGTTGVPKGVFKEHKGVVNSITDLSEKYGMREKPEVVVLFSGFIWEPFVRQSLIALLNSQQLVIVNDTEKLDQMKFPEFLRKYGVTYLNGTASVLQEFDLTQCPSVTKLILVGEEFTESRYKRLREIFKHRIINEYGFTESALVTAMKIFDPETVRMDRSIGRPLRNVKCYILDKDLKQVPIGSIGELHIGGMGISRGYLNCADLTHQKFISNPFQTQEEKLNGFNGRMYKTGDLARWMENGEVEYIGRNDFQIKLRGIRIEPAEIESIVTKYNGVKNCAVVVKSSKPEEESTASSKHLVGYYVSKNGLIGEDALLEYLESKLPRYMIPVRMIQVNHIPVTINGKVDFRALPEIELGKKTSGGSTGNELESKLLRIWSETLDIPLNRIGVKDDFFRLGGHSITCIQLIARIRQNLGLDVNLETIFSLRTIEKISKYLQSTKNEVFQESGLEIGSERQLANSLQQGLIYHYLKQSVIDDAYIMQSEYQYKTKLNIDHYKCAWIYTQSKYPALRLRFIMEKEFFQVPSEDQDLNWRFLDFTKTENVGAAISELKENDRKERYCLESGPLFRVYLIQMADDHFTLLFSCHHIILDGWSFPILFACVHEAYLKGLTSVTSVDTDIAYSQAQRYIELHRNDHVDYWTKEIEKIGQRVNLSGLLNEESRYAVQLSNYDLIRDQKQVSLQIADDLNLELRKFIALNGITMHSILQFVWHKVLHIYGAGSHTVVGTTVSGRNLPILNIERSVGLYINTLPLIVDHEEHNGLTIVQALEQIQGKVNAMNSRSNVELGRLNKGELKHGLFDSLFVLENYPNLGNVQVEDHKRKLGFQFVADVEKLDYPLAVIVREDGNGRTTFTLWYAGELFDSSTMDNVLDLINHLLWQIVKNPEDLVMDLDLVPSGQLENMNQWNSTSSDFPSTKTLHGIFEDQATNYPRRLAVVYESVKLSYSQLNQEANQLSHYMRSLTEIRPNDKIALLLDKNELLILSIFGVWKSGAAFVPIDPSFPSERIKFILADTGAKIIITNQHYGAMIQKLTSTATHVIQIETIKDLTCRLDSSNQTEISSSSRDLAYVIYTSGTTGQPKGVMVEHIGVVNLQKSLAEIFSLRASDDEVILSFSNYVFDHFVEQMTDALLNGQTLVILNDEMRSDKERLYKYMKDNQVTYLSGTPSVLSLYEYNGLSSLRRIDAVGEDFTEPLFNKIRNTFDGLIINGYGPTEVSITSHKRLYQNGDRRKNKSIGHQVRNTTCYVLNKEKRRVPVGAVGELYLGGVGVARGYLNREELTSQVFIPNPFQYDDSKLYKTGDMVRFLPNGEVEYLGRNDFQVKVRGLRIELSEIEAVILSDPGVSHAVVVARNQDTSYANNKFIVGYYVSENVQEQELRKYIQTKLPDYMVPNRLVAISKIPVTINGKVDTKQLPEVEFSRRNDEFVGPRTEVEIRLCSIWSEILNIPEDQISVQDDFFSLGGDSLLVTSLAFMITKSFGRAVGVPQVFLHKTIQSLANLIEHDNGTEITLDISTTHTDLNVCPLSLLQERLLFIDEMENGTNAFNIDFKLKMSNNVDRDALKKSVMAVVTRHEILRTYLPSYSRKQHVIPAKEVEIHFKIATATVRDVTELNQELINASKYIFRLDKEMPIRVTLYEMATTKEFFYMSIVFHHICFDGLSQAIFLRDLNAFYDSFKNGDTAATPNLPSLGPQYKEYAILERRLLTGPRLKMLSNYWLQKLNGVDPLNFLPNFPRPSKFDYTGKEFNFDLDIKTTTALKELAKMLKVSVFSVLVSGFGLTLSHFTGRQKEILIGSPVSNRSRAEFQNVIGCFVNLLVLKVNINPVKTLAEYIQAVSEEVIQSHVHQDMPFEKLVNEVGVEQDLSRHPLVQVIFSLNPFKKDKLSESDLQLVNCPNNFTPAKYDFSATLTETETGISGTFNYATTLFRETTIKSVLATYVYILHQFSPSNCQVQLMTIKPIDDFNYSKLLETSELKVEAEHSSSAKTLHQIFEEVVKISETKTALTFQDLEISYGELNGRSNQVAHYLHSQATLKPDDLIGLLLDKNEHMIISILGVWKSGGAYVPVDPSYPDERIKFIMSDTAAKIWITNQRYSSRLKTLLPTGVKLIEIDAPSTLKTMELQPKSNLTTQCNGDNLSYVIYTSGTTGKPKGVMVEHNGLVNFHSNLTRSYDNYQRVLFLSNYVFDFSIEQLILSIFNSGTLIMVSSDFALDDSFYAYANQKKLNYLSGTPTFIHEIDLSRLKHLENLTVAGEVFSKVQYDKIRSEFQGRVVSAYGVTETTVYNMVSSFANEDVYRNSLGNIFTNMKKYVLDENREIVPVGAIGELYFSGNCLSRGYLNRPDLDKAHFFKNPFQINEEYSRIYKTGDLVRYISDSDLEYLGRNDSQVKIRGLRVEPLEIEAVVSTYPGIKNCVIVPENQRLVGYFLSVNEIPTPSETEIVTFLESKLPSYMIPTRFVHVQGNAFPMTINGKLDTRALQGVSYNKNELSAFTPPRNYTESRMCRLWSSLLGVDNVGIDDNFFRLGGDSIQSLQLVSRIRNEIKCKVTVKDIFLQKTIRKIYDNVLKDNDDDVLAVQGEQGKLTGEVPLLPIQQWFFGKSLIDPNHWNQTFTIMTPELNLEKLKKALKALVEQHDALRLKFKRGDGNQMVQFYEDSSEIEMAFHTLDIRTLAEDNLSAEFSKWQSVFDLEKGPTFCVGVLHGFPDGTARVWWAIHHLLVDTVSWRIIKDDLETLYSGGNLGMKGSSYREFALALQEYSCSETEHLFWKNMEGEIVLWNKQLQQQRYLKHQLTFTLTSEQTKLLQRNYESQITELLLTALGYALKELTGSDTNYVTLEAHGREEIDSKLMLSKTVGWFTSMYPIKIRTNDDIQSSITFTEEIIKEVQNKGIGYGISSGYLHDALPCVTFNYLGQFDQETKKKKNSCWEFTESVGQLDIGCNESNASSSIVDVTGLCKNGILGFTIEGVLDNEKMERFKNTFKTKLEEMAEELPITEFEPYIEFHNERAENGTLFVFPPGEGGAESYFNNIVPGLPQIRLVVFNNYYLAIKPRRTTFEELAKFYIKYIRKIQPKGSYNFLGWSFGGVLAMEVCRQLGDRINNLVMIDSYFNVKKACKNIDRSEEVDIIDPINYFYAPKAEELLPFASNTENIVLFKAVRLNDMYTSHKQFLLYNYYMESEFNNLDTLVNPDSIQLFPMQGDTHVSWVKNPNSVSEICDIISKGMEVSNIVN